MPRFLFKIYGIQFLIHTLFLEWPSAPKNATLSHVATMSQVALYLGWSTHAALISEVARWRSAGSTVSRYQTIPPLVVSTSPQKGATKRRPSPRGKGCGVNWETSILNDKAPFVFT